MVSWLNPWSWSGHKHSESSKDKTETGSSLSSSRSSEEVEGRNQLSSTEESCFQYSMYDYLRLKMEYYERHIGESRFDHKVTELPTSWLILDAQDAFEMAYNQQVTLFDAGCQKADMLFKERQGQLNSTFEQTLRARLKTGNIPSSQEVEKKLHTLQENLEKGVDTHLESKYALLQRFSYEVLRCRKLSSKSAEPLRRKIDSALESAIWNHLLEASASSDLIQKRIVSISQNLQEPPGTSLDRSVDPI